MGVLRSNDTKLDYVLEKVTILFRLSSILIKVKHRLFYL